MQELYYPCEKKALIISCAVTARLICAFVFAYADCWFSLAAARMSTIFQSCREGAAASLVLTSTVGSLKCLAKGHYTHPG